MVQTFGCLGSWLLALCLLRSDEGCADAASSGQSIASEGLPTHSRQKHLNQRRVDLVLQQPETDCEMLSNVASQMEIYNQTRYCL
ncbi:hypothetical protein EDD86DRAFT_201340 [Gorgonomyces haynaldii]|nr:hypothetical protein EDD86DRAFT_201340 [Gorgonomyces haynaldii]